MAHVSQDTFLDHVAALRDASFEIVLRASDRIHGELFCDLDSAEGQSEIKVSSSPEMICSVEAVIQGAPRWVVLRLELGSASFLPGDVLGLILKGAMDKPFPIQVYLRMVRDGQLTDTRFDDSVELAQDTGVITCLHTLSAADPASGESGQCALVLGLPNETAHIRIEDLGFFVIPAAEGLSTSPKTGQ